MENLEKPNNKKKKIIIVIAFIIIILLTFIIIFLINIPWQKYSSGKIRFKDTLSSYLKGESLFESPKVSHIMVIHDVQDNLNAKIIEFYTFDEKDVCTSWNFYETGLTGEEIKERYKIYKNDEKKFENVKIQKDGLSYGIKEKNGNTTKQDILELLIDTDYI